MDNSTEMITRTIINDNLSAPQITHALNELGDGDGMKKGISRIVEYYAEEISNAKTEGIGIGIIASGVVVMLVGGGVWYVGKLKKKRNQKHISEGEQILNSLEGSSFYKEENNND